MNFKSLTVNMVLSAIVIFSVFSFIILNQQQNNTSQLITNNSVINDTYSQLNSNLGAVQGQADIGQQNTFNSSPTESYGIVDVSAVFSPTVVFRSMTLGMYNILIKLPSSFLGVPEIVTGSIGGLLVLTLILGIWSIWRGTQSG